jgi:nitrous oxidase accessory protein NosD
MLNNIIDCNYGVLALSSDPYIFMNYISKSQENGILIKTKNLLRSDALIKYNTVEKNLEYGIVLEGAENYTRVEKNHHINANRKAGIRISEQANVKVLNNRIFGNYGQGILV